MTPDTNAGLPKGRIVLAVGLPGSGKSTYFSDHHIQPLSSDGLRLWLLDDETDQSHPADVFHALHRLLETRLKLHRPRSYIDATNLTPGERRPYFVLAKKYGYDVEAIYFDIPFDECLRRNRLRKRAVPEDVMEVMAKKLVRPTMQEGFAGIEVVRVAPEESGK